MIPSPEQAVMIVVASRSEVIKMAPIYLACKRARIPVLLCATWYDDHQIKQTLSLFDITPDIILPAQTVHDDFQLMFQSVFEHITSALQKFSPFLIMVHGDSASSLAIAMAAFYASIPIAHIEGGLRADTMSSVFPYDTQRRVITTLAAFHFASTPAAIEHIITQGIHRDQIFCTGNTGIDALMIIKEKIMHKQIAPDEHLVRALELWKRNDFFIGLVTLGTSSYTPQEQESLFSIMSTVQHCAWIVVCQNNNDIEQTASQWGFDEQKTILFFNSLSYKNMVYILNTVDIVLTDSVSVQEEAASLGKSVLILRCKTDLTNEVIACQSQIVGFSPLLIMHGIEQALLKDHKKLSHCRQLYGDGHAAEKIAAFVQVRYPELTQSIFMYEDGYYQQKEVE